MANALQMSIVLVALLSGMAQLSGAELVGPAAGRGPVAAAAEGRAAARLATAAPLVERQRIQPAAGHQHEGSGVHQWSLGCRGLSQGSGQIQRTPCSWQSLCPLSEPPAILGSTSSSYGHPRSS